MRGFYSPAIFRLVRLRHSHEVPSWSTSAAGRKSGRSYGLLRRTMISAPAMSAPRSPETDVRDVMPERQSWVDSCHSTGVLDTSPKDDTWLFPDSQKARPERPPSARIQPLRSECRLAAQN
jgi:hypothetical protein